MSTSFFVCVHIGCGNHSANPEIVKQYLSLLRESCIIASQDLKKQIIPAQSSASLPCIEAVKNAVSILEDHPRTNCGLGSNLNWEGKVETDATLACHISSNSQSINEKPKKFHGSVGACQNVKNPIKLCSQILKDQMFGPPLPFGLVKPCFLCGDQAYQYTSSVINDNPSKKSYPVKQYEPNLTICDDPKKNPDFLITNDSKSKWKTCKDAVLSALYGSKNTESSSNPNKDDDDDSLLLDTVGAICIDSQENIACGCSSGGILLKCPGRVGQSAILGAGCDVSHNASVCCTGSGESIMNVQLAKEIISEISTQEEDEEEEEEEISQKIRQVFEKLGFSNSHECGCICVKKEEYGRYEFGFGFTTKSMGIGYFSSKMKKPICEIHRKDEKKTCFVGSALV